MPIDPILGLIAFDDGDRAIIAILRDLADADMTVPVRTGTHAAGHLRAHLDKHIECLLVGQPLQFRMKF